MKRFDFNLSEMVLTQLSSWELVLRKKGLANSTIDRKIKNIGLFFIHLEKIKNNKMDIKISNISEILYEFVRDGYFSTDNIDNEGTVGYRRNIYQNIREGFQYIYEDMFGGKEVIKELSKNQIETLDEVSKNKWFKICSLKNDKHTIQTKLLEELGIRIYFDENENPYALSHELAELIDKKHKDIMKSIRLIIERFGRRKKSPTSEHVDFSVFEETYTDCQNKTVTTLRLYKDILINYILGLNGDKYFDFKVDYQSAFNYIEQENARLLQENMQLKESFLEMYNQIRKRNRDLLIQTRKVI